MIAADTSVLVAGFATWHEAHESAVRVLNRGVRLVAHAAVETYSVLTRLPPPHRGTPPAAHTYLAEVAIGDYLVLDARSYRQLIEKLADHRISGGAGYDALVGLTAKVAGARLLTRDQRAIRTYELLDVDYELVP
ncbi:MAG: type II toxin-antitoxin system VapC family toxin [Mycolicibacterium sp.]|nr:type II toxin-antitoxin system VapC family toxin [Mycolicibacterium sp.]